MNNTRVTFQYYMIETTTNLLRPVWYSTITKRCIDINRQPAKTLTILLTFEYCEKKVSKDYTSYLLCYKMKGNDRIVFCDILRG